MNIKTIITYVLCTIAFMAMAQTANLPRKTMNGKEYYVYKVEKGEGFYAISKKFNISEEEIVKYNPAAKNGLKRDQVLFIPINDESSDDSKSINTTFTHTIKRGETLYGIAAMYNVTIDDIREYNQGIHSRINAGDKLIIPQKGNNSKATDKTNTKQKNQVASEETNYIYHTIVSGETLYAISHKYDVSVKKIIQANPGIKPNKLAKGAVIRIPTQTPHQPEQDSNLIANTNEEKEANVVSQEHTQPDAKEISQNTYTAKKKETFFSIAQKFDLPIDSLKVANRNIRKVSEGTILVIPSLHTQQKLAEEVKEEDSKEYLDSLYNQIYDKKDTDHINVAVMLPFMLNEQSSIKSSLYTEYYQGFLLAVDSLKRQGYSINLTTYDTQDSIELVKEILDDPHLTVMDLIIAPEDDEAIDLIADFGEKYDINVVNTFSLKNEKVNTNARVFQTNIPASYFYAETVALFIKTFKNRSIVFLENKDLEETENVFVTLLKGELDERNIKYTTCSYSTVLNASDLRSISALPSVVFVPTSNKKEAIVTLLPGLVEFTNKTPMCNVSLFGYPNWVPQINKNINKLYKLDTYIFSRFYTVPDDTRLYDLSIKYLYWYNEEMQNASPRYAILGFDTGLYFMSAIAKHGKHFANYEMPQENNAIQTDFRFERINNWSGFINKSFYFVHLSPDMKIEKISN